MNKFNKRIRPIITILIVAAFFLFNSFSFSVASLSEDVIEVSKDKVIDTADEGAQEAPLGIEDDFEKEKGEVKPDDKDAQETPSEIEENLKKEKGEVKPDSNDGEKESNRIVLKAANGRCTVWFDGTLGLGATNSLVKGATNTKSFTDNNGQITLPTTAGTNSKYKLNGWYDVREKKWYPPGTNVVLQQDTVFYADWILADYNLKQSGSLANNQANTTSFVKTNLFDYNELFNANHGAGLNSIQINDNSHSEEWKDQGGSSFLFMNWYNQNVNSYMSLGAPKELTLGRNAYNENNGHGITKNIVSSLSDTLLEDLFSPQNGVGKQYLGNGNNLFLFDGDGRTENRGFGEGYYYYDSDYNGADYNRSEQKFYVYDNVQNIQGENRTFNGYWTNKEKRPGFMPFEQGEVKEKSGQTDYWFGMNTSVDFFLPDDVGINDGNCNKSVNQKDMRFYFSGDDDVWVFVDDQLVLDLGGIHQRCAGDINFSTGEIKYYNVTDTGETLASTDKTTLKSIKSGSHELKIYYLERGSSWSNCSIYFNLSPRYDLEIIKTDANDENKLLPGAEFSVYRDKDCTVPAILYDNKECKGSPKSVFETNEQGIIQCYGLCANQTYYLKETSSPSAYPSVADKIITLTIDANGNASLINTDSSFSTVSQNGSTQINMKVNNEKPDKTSVEVEKKWFNEDGTPLTENLPESIRVQLYRSVIKQVSPEGGSGGVSIPVNITTQFFDVGGAPGSNMDTSPIVKGDLTKNMIMESGGTLHLELDHLKKKEENDYKTGIYSITVNGVELTPTNVSARANENCYIGGGWGNYPPRKARYDIENITKETDIKITLIGYLNGDSGGNASVEKTLIMQTSITDPSQSGGESQPETPITKPSDAVKVGDEIILNKGNEWKYTWDNLEVTNEDGTETYYYYVEEIPVEGYSTSYSGNGTVGGKVTVTNVRQREIEVKKRWESVNGSEMESGMPESISGVLIQTDISEGNNKKEIAFTLNKDSKWSKKWKKNDTELGEKEGHIYSYTVKETTTLNGFEEPIYENNNGVEEGMVMIVNKKKLYTLPSAGGRGTYWFFFVGSFLIALSLMLLKKEKMIGKSTFALKHAGVIALTLCILAQNTYAADQLNIVPEIDKSKKLSLTIEHIHGEKTAVVNSEFCFCKIANIRVEKQSAYYTYTNEFSKEGEFPKTMTAAESSKLAKKLYEKVKTGKISTIKGKTDERGQLVFTGLTPGMYLVAQTKERQIYSEVFNSDPFIVSVPQPVPGIVEGNNEWKYEVIAGPKSINVTEKIKPKKRGSPKKPVASKKPIKKRLHDVITGDFSKMQLYGVAMIVSGIVLCIYIMLYKKRRGLQKKE